MNNEKRVDRASCEIRASAKAVFAAFADPAAWEQWLPPEGMTGSIDEFDFRIGGRFRLTLTYADGSGAGKTQADTDVVEGTFAEIAPYRRVVLRIVFESGDPAFTGEMRMVWSLESIDTGTRVTITAHDVPVGISPEDHEVGLNSTLENLAMYLEQKP